MNLSERGQQQLAIWEAEDAERKGPCPSGHRACFGAGESRDCRHLHSALSWWCGNSDAIVYRRTLFPGTYNCPFYEPKRGLLKRQLSAPDQVLIGFALAVGVVLAGVGVVALWSWLS